MTTLILAWEMQSIRGGGGGGGSEEKDKVHSILATSPRSLVTLMKYLELWPELSRERDAAGGSPGLSRERWGAAGGEPRAASGRTCFPGRPAELRSLQATAPEGFGSSRVSSPSSFTSCRIKLTKAASSRLGRRSFSSKPSRQSGQPARCLPLQYSTMQSRQKLWLQPVSRTGSVKYCRQQAQLRSTAPRSRSRSTAAAMARPGRGAERSGRRSFVFPGRLLPRGSCRVPESEESAGTGEDGEPNGSPPIYLLP